MKSIGLSDEAHRRVHDLAKSLDMTYGQFVEQSALYFKRTGIDPSKEDVESPNKVLKEMERRLSSVIATLKRHEQERMTPLFEQLLILSREVEKAIGDAPKESTFRTVLRRTEEMMEQDLHQHELQLKAQQVFYTQHFAELKGGLAELFAEQNRKLDEMAAEIKLLRGEILRK